MKYILQYSLQLSYVEPYIFNLLWRWCSLSVWCFFFTDWLKSDHCMSQQAPPKFWFPVNAWRYDHMWSCFCHQNNNACTFSYTQSHERILRSNFRCFTSLPLALHVHIRKHIRMYLLVYCWSCVLVYVCIYLHIRTLTYYTVIISIDIKLIQRTNFSWYCCVSIAG